MKKQKKQFLILMMVLVVAIVGSLGTMKYLEYAEQKEAEELAANTIYITKLNPEDIESFTCWYQGEERPFVKEDGKWIAMQDPSVEIQQPWLNQMAAALAQMIAVQKMENVTDLAQFGFDASYKQYDIHTADETYELVLGDFNDLTDCYYMYEISNPSVVYSIEPSFVTGFVSTVEAVAVVEEE